MTLADIAAALGGELCGPRDLPIETLCPPNEPALGAVAVAFGPEALAAAEACGVGAVVIPRDLTTSLPAVRVDQPRVALIMLLAALEPPRPDPSGVHPAATVDATASLGPDTSIGPYCVVEAGAVLGARVRLGPGCHIGPRARLGDDCELRSRVVVGRDVVLGRRVIVQSGAIIGEDGFGFRQDGGRNIRIPQLGTVVLEDDVEIGANTIVDRATIGTTRIGRGTKVDSLVVVAHNCRIGEDCIVVAQAGMAGSVTIGDQVMIGGQAGIADHHKVGSRARLAAQAGLMDDVPADGRWFGTPAMPEKVFFRMIAGARRLRQVFVRLRAIEQKIGIAPPGAAEE